MTALLRIKNLHIKFQTEEGAKPVVKAVDFTIQPREKVGLLGESGSGKSVTALSILRLLPQPFSLVTADQILWHGEDLQAWKIEKFHREFRWKKASIVFQEAGAAFNPVITLGEQFREITGPNKVPWARVEQILLQCGFAEPLPILQSYPHLLSGGMKQRLMLAMALLLQPELIITDEPTSAIDSTLQRRLLGLVEDWVKERAMAWLMISHDLNLVGRVCDRIYIFYAGHVVEEALASDLFRSPHHPYTEGLIKASVRLDQARRKNFQTIPGQVPERIDECKGCVFQNRCPYVSSLCREEEPILSAIDKTRRVACFFPRNL